MERTEQIRKCRRDALRDAFKREKDAFEKLAEHIALPVGFLKRVAQFCVLRILNRRGVIRAIRFSLQFYCPRKVVELPFCAVSLTDRAIILLGKRSRGDRGGRIRHLSRGEHIGLTVDIDGKGILVIMQFTDENGCAADAFLLAADLSPLRLIAVAAANGAEIQRVGIKGTHFLGRYCAALISSGVKGGQRLGTPLLHATGTLGRDIQQAGTDQREDGKACADKTFALVRAAYIAGRPVCCIYTNEKEQWGPVILTLAECSSTSAIFTRYTEVYQGDTRLVWITLSASGALDATTTIDASSVAYSGSVGEYSPKNVSAAIEALMNYTDDKVGSITEDATADYSASGASSVQAWATMAKTGSTTQYRVAAGEYRVTDAGDVYTVRIVDSTYTSWTIRRVEIVSSDDEANAYWSIYTATNPGLISYESIGIAGDGGSITLQGKLYQLPPLVTAADNGAFMRVVNGAWAAAQLTDVSEVGA